jgi:hypothetical protein
VARQHAALERVAGRQCRTLLKEGFLATAVDSPVIMTCSGIWLLGAGFASPRERSVSCLRWCALRLLPMPTHEARCCSDNPDYGTDAGC